MQIKYENNQLEKLLIKDTFLNNYKAQKTTVGAFGEYVILWLEEVCSKSDAIFVQKFNAEEEAINNIPLELKKIEKSKRANHQVNVTSIGELGDYVVTSFEEDSIFVQKYNTEGLAENRLIEIKGIDNNKFKGNVQIEAIGQFGEYTITWHENKTIFVHKVKTDGKIINENPIEIIRENDIEYNFKPQIQAVGDFGEYVLTWYETTNKGDLSIFVQKFNCDGTILNKKPIELEGIRSIKEDQNSVNITAIGDLGEYVVAWKGFDEKDEYSFFVQKFNEDGTILNNKLVKFVSIKNTKVEDYIPQVTPFGDLGEFIVAWRKK